MEKFSRTDKNRVCGDWMKAFPAMGRYRPMWLLKRNGPILVGICLDGNRDNTAYRIIPHIHNLARPTGFVSLQLRYPLINKRGTYREELTVKSHDKEFSDATERLKKQTLFPLSEELSLSNILSACDRYVGLNLAVETPIFIYEDVISLLVWCGDPVEATRRLAEYVRIMSDWEERIFERDGGRNACFDRLYEIIERPKQQEYICDQQLELLRLKKIPDYGLICL